MMMLVLSSCGGAAGGGTAGSGGTAGGGATESVSPSESAGKEQAGGNAEAGSAKKELKTEVIEGLPMVDMTKWQYNAEDDVYWQVGIS